MQFVDRFEKHEEIIKAVYIPKNLHLTIFYDEAKKEEDVKRIILMEIDKANLKESVETCSFYPDEKEINVISWWENELNSDERSNLLIKSWSQIGENTKEGIKKRHEEMNRMYALWRQTQSLIKTYGKTESKTDVLGLGKWNLWQPIKFNDEKIRRIAHIEYRNMAVDLIRFEDGKELFTEDIKDNFSKEEFNNEK